MLLRLSFCFFTSVKKQSDTDLETKLNEKRHHKKGSVKYLGIQIHQSSSLFI